PKDPLISEIHANVLLDTGAEVSVISQDMVLQSGITSKKSTGEHIIETADGREITLSQKVRVRIRMPGVDKSSVSIEEDCLIMPMNNPIHTIILSRSCIEKAGLISWMQQKDHGDIDSKLENSIDLEIPQPLEDVDKSSWTCGIPRLR
ncbi:hypothetical protein ADUPG1_003665, partial [Aduncisulcus paluster]